MLLTTRDARIHAQQGDAGRRWNFARFFGCACTHAHSCCFVVDDVIRLTVTRWPSLAFGLMSLIFHAFECGTNATGYSRTWIKWCSTWLSGKVGSGWSLSLASFTSHRRALSWPRVAVTFSPHSDACAFCAPLFGLSCLASHLRHGVSVAKVFARPSRPP
jgi:hypothetical protein